MTEFRTIAEHFERTLEQDHKQSLPSSRLTEIPIWALHRVETLRDSLVNVYIIPLNSQGKTEN